MRCQLDSIHVLFFPLNSLELGFPQIIQPAMSFQTSALALQPPARDWLQRNPVEERRPGDRYWGEGTPTSVSDMEGRLMSSL